MVNRRPVDILPAREQGGPVRPSHTIPSVFQEAAVLEAIGCTPAHEACLVLPGTDSPGLAPHLKLKPVVLAVVLQSS